MQVLIVVIATLIASIDALKITSPSSGQVLDPTQPITVTWTSESGDPATVDILASDPNGFISETRVGRDVSTSSGTFIIPASSIQSYGTGWVIKVDGSDGKLLATSPPFDLSVGVGAQVNGQPGLVQSSTFTGTPAATSTSTGATMTSGSSSSRVLAVSTSSGSSGSSSGSTSESTTLTGSRTGFSTSTMSGTSRSTSTTHSASSTSASSAATTSANAQPRLASGSQIVLSGAGLVAGLAALLA